MVPSPPARCCSAHPPTSRSDRRIANATCGTIRLRLLKIGAQVRITVRRVKIAMATACPYANELAPAYARIRAAAL